MDTNQNNQRVGSDQIDVEIERPLGGSPEEGTPRWVKVFGIIALVLVLIVVIAHLVGGGPRGHGMQ